MALIAPGTPAPQFRLEDQFGTLFDTAAYRGRSHLLLLFYPRDWTPTCSHEVPELDALADRFATEAHTQVAAVSTDSRYSHNAWAADNGGVSYPILSDSNPYGALSRALGAWVPKDQISDRATVLIDRHGVVRYASSVGVDGRRNLAALLEIARQLDARDGGAQVPYFAARRFASPATLYLKSDCHFSTRARRALANLHAEADVVVRYADLDRAAYDALVATTGRADVPTLVSEDGVVSGVDPIMRALAARYARAAR